MIVAINNKTNKLHYGKTRTEIANLIGVCPSTISNWMKKGNCEIYNGFTLYFECIELKAKKGFAIYDQNIYTLNHT